MFFVLADCCTRIFFCETSITPFNSANPQNCFPLTAVVQIDSIILLNFFKQKQVFVSRNLLRCSAKCESESPVRDKSHTPRGTKAGWIPLGMGYSQRETPLSWRGKKCWYHHKLKGRRCFTHMSPYWTWKHKNSSIIYWLALPSGQWWHLTLKLAILHKLRTVEIQLNHDMTAKHHFFGEEVRGWISSEVHRIASIIWDAFNRAPTHPKNAKHLLAAASQSWEIEAFLYYTWDFGLLIGLNKTVEDVTMNSTKWWVFFTISRYSINKTIHWLIEKTIGRWINNWLIKLQPFWHERNTTE